MLITKIVKTCFACPVQLDFWTAEEQFYFRYRWGSGRIDNVTTDTREIYTWEGESDWDGQMSDEEIFATLKAAGFTIDDTTQLVMGGTPDIPTFKISAQ